MGSALLRVLAFAGIFAVWNVGTEALLSDPAPAVVDLLPIGLLWLAVGCAAPFFGSMLNYSRSSPVVVLVVGAVVGLLMTAISPTYATAPFLLNWLERAGRYVLIFWLLGMKREAREIIKV
jgi:hypothetical protein